MSEEKSINEFRIGSKSKPKEIITQCEKLLKDEKVKDLHLSAVSYSIGELVSIVEILKSIYPNLSQKNIFTTLPARPTKNNKDKKAEPKLYPKLEIVLSTGKITEENSVKISEDERNKLIDTLEKNKEILIKRRKFRRPFRRNRKWGFNARKPRYSYSARRTGYNVRRYGFNKRPYGKAPIGKRNNVRKFNGTRKISGNRQAVPAKN